MPENDERDANTGAPDALPRETVETVERLTRLARDAVDEQEAAAYRDRRSAVLDDYGFTARVREDENEATLVCHPAEWLDADGVVDFEAIDDTARATEVVLSGPGEQGAWAEAEARNRDVVETVRAAEGAVHAANARAFADFMGNHYASPISAAREHHVREFLEEYYPRNAWPTDEERAVVEQSLRAVFEKTEKPYPLD
ncbi:MAG: DUF7108 family protein [Halobacteriota archaeon]